MKKFLSIPVLLLVTVFLFGLAPISSPVMPPVYSSTEVDDTFPVQFLPSVDPNSVIYLPNSLTSTNLPESSENAGYDLDLFLLEQLDTSRLSASLLVSLKGTASSGSTYHVTVSKDGIILLDDDISDNTLTIPNLIYNDTYDITVSQTSPFQVVKYIGSLWYAVDVDNTVFTEITYQKMILPGQYQTRNVTTVSETESNNTTTTADAGCFSTTIKGTMSTASDIDYFVFSVPNDSTYNGGQINITLATPNLNSGTGGLVNYGIQLTCRRNGTIYYSKTSTQAGASDDYIFTGKSLGGYTLQAGDQIFVKVYLANTNITTTAISSNPYYLNVSVQHKFAWYSQYTGKAGTYNAQWNTNKLDNLYFPQSSYNGSCFIKDQTVEHGNAGIMSRGCFISSTAMVLRNMGKTMNGTDFRTGFVGPLFADPFTVTLANVNRNGSEIKYSSGKYNLSNVSVDPVSVNLPNILSKFSATYRQGINLTGTTAQNMTTLANLLPSNSSKGIIVLLKKGTNTHYIVIVGDRGSSYTADGRFIVCDPGTISSSKGDNVIFTNSWSYKSGGYKMSNASRYWTIG